jgi:hypothetical protein
MTLALLGRAMIKRKRGSPGDVGSNIFHMGRRSSPDDVQRLLVEQWRRQIVEERSAPRQRPLLNTVSPVHPSLDEIRIVSRIGRLRLLWKFGRVK